MYSQPYFSRASLVSIVAGELRNGYSSHERVTAAEVIRKAACDTGLILGLRPANERRCYFVTTSLIGLAQSLNQSCDTYLLIIPNDSLAMVNESSIPYVCDTIKLSACMGTV